MHCANIHCLRCAPVHGRGRPIPEAAHTAEEVVLYASPMSGGRIVHWMLEETGASYRYEVVNLERRDAEKPDHPALNPMARVPTLVHRGTVVTECGAICAYLADAFPAARLAPPTDSPARGTYYRWMFLGGSCFEPALIDHMLSRPPASRPGAVGCGSYDALETLAQALNPGPYLLGSQFSAADVYIASQIGFGTMMEALDRHGVLRQYSRRLQQRPAYGRFVDRSEQIAAQMRQAS